MRRRWTFLLLALLLVASCAPREGRKPAPPPARKKGEEAAAQPKRELTFARQAKPPAALPPVSTEQTLPALVSPQVLPEDFSLGKLQDLLAASREEREAAAAADRFLAGLGAGKVTAELLVPELREEIAGSLAFYLEQGLRPISHRLGAMSLQENETNGRTAWMKVRLFGDIGVSQGDLYLSQREGKWYVSDLQVNFPLLDRPYERNQEKFIPSEYSWRLE